MARGTGSSTTLKVGWDGLEGAIRGLRGVPPVAAAQLGTAVRLGTNAARREVRAAAPRRARARGFTKGMGGHRVVAGIRARVRGSGTDTVGRVYLTQAAIPVATGWQAHAIAPRADRGHKALQFVDGYAAHAVVPAHAGNPFFATGVQRALPDIDAGLQAAGAEVLDVIVRNIDADRKGA